MQDNDRRLASNAMSRYPPAYARDAPIEPTNLREGHASKRSHAFSDPDTSSAWCATVRSSGLSQREAAKQIGIGVTMLKRYLHGDPVPLVVVKATQTVVLIEGIRRLLDATPNGQHVPRSKLRELHPSLAVPVRIKAPKPVRKARVKAVKPARPKPIGKKRRGIGAGRTNPGEEAKRREQLAAIHPWHRSVAAMSLRERAKLAGLPDAVIDETVDADAPENDPPRGKIITRLI